MKKVFVFIALVVASFAAIANWGPSTTLPSNYAPPLDGQVVSIATGTVLDGVRAAIAGKAGTMVMVDPLSQEYLFIWQYSGVGSGFWGINMSTAKAVDLLNIFKTSGNLANARTVSDLINGLKDAGWTVVPGASVPPLLATIINAGKVAASVDGTLGLFMVVPVNQQGLFLDWFSRYNVQS